MSIKFNIKRLALAILPLTIALLLTAVSHGSACWVQLEATVGGGELDWERCAT